MIFDRVGENKYYSFFSNYPRGALEGTLLSHS
nr:MAG TPA: hypothetical protein [Caudoviricetes sp.]